MQRSTITLIARVVAVVATMANTAADALPPAQLAATYNAMAGTPGDPVRGERFFAASHGREWRCASCHGTPPTEPGRHAATGRAIGALAPAFQPGRFTDPAKVEKWFKRNCHDVLGRECTAAEKADVLAWLINLKP